MNDSPCHYCQSRRPGCHDTCREYIEWQQKWAETRDRNSRQRHETIAIWDLHRRAIRKARKGRK